MKEHEIDHLLVGLYNSAYSCGYNNAQNEPKESAKAYRKHTELAGRVKIALLQQPDTADQQAVPCRHSEHPREGYDTFAGR